MTMNPNLKVESLVHQAPGEERAFTLTELLVVLTIVALLGLLVTRSLADTRARSPRELCASNLHQMWVALRVYADENNDRVPQTSANTTNGPGSAIWDLPRSTADLVLRYGASQANFYCPSMDKISTNFMWEFSTYRLIGYQWLMERNNLGSPGFDPSRPTRRPDGLPYISKLSTPFVSSNTLSKCELITDLIISEGTGTVADKFENVITANPSQFPNGYSSSHMQARYPAGGYILFQDGHVDWRPFNQMGRKVDWSANRHWWW